MSRFPPTRLQALANVACVLWQHQANSTNVASHGNLAQMPCPARPPTAMRPLLSPLRAPLSHSTSQHLSGCKGWRLVEDTRPNPSRARDRVLLTSVSLWCWQNGRHRAKAKEILTGCFILLLRKPFPRHSSFQATSPVSGAEDFVALRTGGFFLETNRRRY